jgi:hypothetical protein
MRSTLLALVVLSSLSAITSAQSSKDPCPCPGPGCPDGGEPPAECRKKADKDAAKFSCPDPTCAELPAIVSDAKCPCPGPGCPDGGWFGSDAVLTDSRVAYCLTKAEEVARKKSRMCRRLGHCGNKPSPEQVADLPPLLFDKDCPCPGPGCPDGGWFNGDLILTDPGVAACYRKAEKLQIERERRRKGMRDGVKKVQDGAGPSLPK